MPKPLFQQLWQGDSIELCHRFKPGSVDCVISDPPFGVDNKSNQAVTEAGKKYARKIANDESPEIAMKVFQAVMHALVPKMKQNSDIYIFTSYQVLLDWMQMCDRLFGAYQFERKAVLTWVKDGPGMGDLQVPWGMGQEFILFYRRGSFPLKVKRGNSVLNFSQVRPNKLIHPHEKPLPLLQALAKASTDEYDFLVDPFGGSSSLARAMRAINRSCVTIELDEQNHQFATEAFHATSVDLFG